MSAPAASIIVPTHNKARYLSLTLASYVRQSAPRFEVIVVDDGSSDDTAEVVGRYADRLSLRYFRWPHRGRSAARNQAIAEAHGGLLIFADDDRIAAPGFVAGHLAEHDRAEGPRVVIGWQEGVVSHFRPDVSFPLESLRRIVTQRPELSRLFRASGPVDLITADDVIERFDEVVRPLTVFEPWWDHCLPVILRHGDALAGLRIAWVISATGNLSAPRASVGEVGGFDEGFTGWGLEDLDLCYRLEERGARTVVSREATNFHQAHASGQVASRWMQWLTNLRHFMSKYDALAPALYAHFFTRSVEPDLIELNRLVDESSRFAAARPASARALRAALVALVDARIADLMRSDAARLPGVNW